MTSLLLFTGCNDKYAGDDFDGLGYAESVFGVQFNPNHDWNTSVSSSIDVGNNVVKILVADTLDNSLRLLNEGSGTIYFDVPKNHYALFAYKDGIYKKFNLGDNKIDFNSNSRVTRAGENPIYTSHLTGTVETYAGQRGWIPGEVFYTYEPVILHSSGYDDDFKTTFRSVIFNYFPNGRAYDNLPKIKKSGYYNESSYPITTGEKPIIVSPVYKNDGGYYEISNAELYYYYFKGDLSRAEIEALPKYRAIDLSEVYTNDVNDIIEKSNQYVLMYWDEGTSKFPPGYKIGFCYKSNTHVDKKNNQPVEIGNKKQGELYCDGRLNFNINSWGNFKTSGLGPEEPRMAWMSVNDKMFLCIESGTDKDFNDLIIEVEGGIKPIIIPPDDPENQYYTFCFEDRRLGDYDLNDVVIKGTRLDETHVEWTLMACGANDELFINQIEGKRINRNVEVHAIFGKTPNQFINTVKGDNVPYVKDTVIVDKNFSFLNVDNQPFVYDKTQDWEVKIARRGEDPHAIMIPYNFRWALEKVRISNAYKKFNTWGEKMIEETDWYKYPQEFNIF